MKGIGAPLGVKLAGTDPAPITTAARAVHVVAAVRLVRHHPALRAFLTVLLDGRCGGLLNSGVTARPVCAGLPRMGVAVRETVPETLL